MPMNISHAENAHLEGEALFQEWQQKFMLDWNAPVIDTMVARLWGSIPPEAKAYYQQQHPQAFEILRKRMEGS